MGNNIKKRTHRRKAYYWSKYFIIVYSMHLPKAIGKVSDFGISILDFEEINTW